MLSLIVDTHTMIDTFIYATTTSMKPIDRELNLQNKNILG